MHPTKKSFNIILIRHVKIPHIILQLIPMNAARAIYLHRAYKQVEDETQRNIHRKSIYLVYFLFSTHTVSFT